MIESVDLHIAVYTMMVSGIAVLFITPLALVTGYISAHRSRWYTTLGDIVATLPLAVPPVAVGIFLLEMLARDALLGQLLEDLGLQIPFTWRGVVLALAVMSFPLVFRPVRSAFQDVDPKLEQLSGLLGKPTWQTFFRVSIPLAHRGILSGVLMGWARALGEFGCTIILAGDIPGETRTLSLAIFHRFQMGEDAAALRLAFLTAVATALLVWAANRLQEGTRP